jgi:hypothetical protein
VLKVQKALYSLKQSGREWYIEAYNGLAKLSLTPSFSNLSVFTNKDKSLIIGLYVDNILVLGRSLDTVNVFKEQFSKMYKIKDLKEIRVFLGLKVTQDRASWTLTIS